METLGSIRSFVRRSLRLWIPCMILCLVAWAAADAVSQPSGDNLSVGGGSTRAYFSWQGEWLGMVPSWTGGRSLFEKGGFIVVANDGDGSPRVVANSAEGNLLSLHGEGDPPVMCCEGMKGGNRAPSLNPDDDADGKINEDRLDGIDNDDDGLVDEDFAAIGDEMVVGKFETRGQDNPKLRFHQESYAWALSHIEGMIAIRLFLENAGTDPLEEVRIGALLQKSGPFSLSEELFTNRANLQMTPQQARAVVCASPAGTAIALLFPDMAPAQTEGDQIGWTVWSTLPGEPAASAVNHICTGGVGPPAGYMVPDNAGSPALADNLLTKRAKEEDRILFGGLSPSLGQLEPGETVEVTVFLVAIRNEETVDRTLVDVHRTYLGDGIHRFIPPPVPVTPVAVWGSYERIEEPKRGIRVIIEKDQSKSINFESVSFINGVDLNDFDISVGRSGETEVTVFGKSAERILKKAGDRIVLKGRDENGVFFDAILNARRNVSAAASEGVETAEVYWKTAGKLSEELLLGSPNPFREQTSIFYEVPTVVETEDGRELKFWGTEETSLKVYNVTGRLVNILVDEEKPAGHYRVDWRAVDENDIPVASGVYYIKLQIGKRYITKRILLLK
jgi:hypothetical protein